MSFRLYAHALFMAQYQSLMRDVEALKAKDPQNYSAKNASKRLAAITRLVFDIIPQDPARPDYRQGKTLGGHHKHWFRAKFFQQYRLFFRDDLKAKIIIYAWVNDDTSKRAYESDDDAYKVFAKMLKSGHPPDDWAMLLQECSAL